MAPRHTNPYNCTRHHGCRERTEGIPAGPTLNLKEKRFCFLGRRMSQRPRHVLRKHVLQAVEISAKCLHEVHCLRGGVPFLRDNSTVEAAALCPVPKTFFCCCICPLRLDGISANKPAQPLGTAYQPRGGKAWLVLCVAAGLAGRNLDNRVPFDVVEITIIAVPGRHLFELIVSESFRHKTVAP